MSAPIPPAYLGHLAAATGPDPASVRDFWAPDGVLEFPYAGSVGSAGRLDGVDAIVGYFDGLRTFRDWSFEAMRAWKIEGSEEYVLETHGSAVIIATGARYEQDYIVRFGLTPDGRLAWMREFWDPTRA
ncbi:MAG: nuclear transport factor 2 family protein [Solirubrobacteraceae bacterium]|nr:nuclear transport factor 2 family protein [Solirubrobacteraceae bacterium]